MTLTGAQEPLDPLAVARQTRRGGLAGVGHFLAPIGSARGMARWMLWIGVAIVVMFVVFALFAPWIAPYRFDQYISHGHRFPKLGHPSHSHWLGTNSREVDELSLVIYGARTALEVVVVAVAFSLVVGVPLGLVSGYYGGVLDRILVLIMDAMFAFPYLLLAIVVAFLLAGSVGGGIMTAAIAITVVYVPQYFRIVRNSVISVREEPFVEAARALGAKPRTIMWRYLFVNVIQTVPVIATLNAADAILTLAGLGFLGYGIQPTAAAEWGYEIQRALDDIGSGIWWTGIPPGLAIILLVTGLTLVGEGLNDLLNPVLRRRFGRHVHMPARPASTEPVTT